MLATLAPLPSLSRLNLELSVFEDVGGAVDFRLLAACRSLSVFQVRITLGEFSLLSNAQLEQIRSSLGQLDRFSAGWMQPTKFARLLLPPVTARRPCAS